MNRIEKTNLTNPISRITDLKMRRFEEYGLIVIYLQEPNLILNSLLLLNPVNPGSRQLILAICVIQVPEQCPEAYAQCPYPDIILFGATIKSILTY